MLLVLIVMHMVIRYRLYDLAKLSTYRVPLRQWVTKRRIARAGAGVLQVVIPILLIVGPQYVLVYRAEDHLALVGKRFTVEAAKILSTLGVYVYKYETYTGPEPISGQVFYYDESRKATVDRIVADDGKVNLLSYAVAYPLETVQTVFIKTVGAFQSYEWSTYRLTLENIPNYVFVFGLFIFCFFVFVNLAMPLNVLRSLRGGRSFPFHTVVLWMAIDLIVLSYTLLSPVETRFIVPAFPILTATTLYVGWRAENRRSLLIVLIIGIVLYLITYQVLQVSRI
jgi:hypothetical protein